MTDENPLYNPIATDFFKSKMDQVEESPKTALQGSAEAFDPPSASTDLVRTPKISRKT